MAILRWISVTLVLDFMLWRAQDGTCFILAAASSATASILSTAAVLTCEDVPGIDELHKLVSESAGKGFHCTKELGELSQVLWFDWASIGPSATATLSHGSRVSALALLGDDPPPRHYCLTAHVAAGFFVARSMHFAYAGSIGREGQRDVEIPQELILQIYVVLTQAILLLGYNRVLDFGRLAGWSVGAAQIIDAMDALRRACPQAFADGSDSPTCTVGALEDEFQRGLALSGHPLRGVAVNSNTRAFKYAIDPWHGALLPPSSGSCRARAAAGGSPCYVLVWYLGTHEALFREVRSRWSLLTDDFEFNFARVNSQGIYSPGDYKPHRWTLAKLNFGHSFEEVLDIQPVASKLRFMLDAHKEKVVEGRGGQKVDAEVLLCTIPAYTCSAFQGMPLPIVMYAANPATAQVPFTQHDVWLRLLAAFAANPKNQLLVSNTWSQMQFEYQVGISFPVIRVHGLYTNAHWTGNAQGNREDAISQVLVYDRTSPLFARALEALRQATVSPDGLSQTWPSQFVHHDDTDRKYTTFASYGAVVFVPGDVEQMAFYEFYTMGIPTYVPDDIGRYMWPNLPEEGITRPSSCGEFQDWIGVWDLAFANGSTGSCRIQCNGTISLAGIGSGTIQELELMDERGFTHCIRSLDTGVHVRLRLQSDFLQLGLVHRRAPCSGLLLDAATAAEKPAGKSRIVPGSLAWAWALYDGTHLGTWILASGTRHAESEVPPQRSMWLSGIFGSVFELLEARLPGPQRTRHSPFGLRSCEAAREWATVIDYFRFPAVGHFVSAAELLFDLKSRGVSGMRAMNRQMKEFSASSLHQTTQQWQTVLNSVIG